MVRFWDTSALMPLLVREATSARLQDLLRRDPAVAIWWGTPVECSSGLARLQRDGRLAQSGLRQAQGALDDLRAGALEIEPTEEVRSRALRLLAVHRLRAGDALQLAAALIWSQERVRGVGFVCLDDRLRGAAAREGFQVLPYAEDVHEVELDRDPAF
jgi:predicted nucleic acid-binding protein